MVSNKVDLVSMVRKKVGFSTHGKEQSRVSTDGKEKRKGRLSFNGKEQSRLFL